MAAVTGLFATVQAVRDWIEAQFGVVYTIGSLYILAAADGGSGSRRYDFGTRKSIPRFKRLGNRGLEEHLVTVGLKAGQGIVCGNGRRLGLCGRV